jgi:hypothetical protein
MNKRVISRCFDNITDITMEDAVMVIDNLLNILTITIITMKTALFQLCYKIHRATIQAYLYTNINIDSYDSYDGYMIINTTT